MHRTAARTTTALLAAALAAALLGSAPAWAAPGDRAPTDQAADLVSAGAATRPVEAFAEDGSISRVQAPAVSPFLAVRPQGVAPVQGDGDVTPLVRNGDPATKLDVVVIGDGYSAQEQEKFRTDAAEKWREVTAVEPYATYRGLFNVWAVSAVSPESGVTGDPDQATVRHTALGSYFWCDGVERLLCVDEKAVERYAAKAPQADLVLVVANSAKYGGAGYNDVKSPLGYEGIATVAGGNAKSGQIAVHETGHSLGKLADEYAYDGQGTYQGAEPAEPNISTLTADRMRQQGSKWSRWLGQATPDGGTVGTYEGGGYYPTGLYRPTENSIMRSLGREFNLPGREAMIAGFYRHATPLTSPTAEGSWLTGADRLAVDLPVPGTRLRWYLDGRELVALRDRTALELADLKLTGPRWRPHLLTAVATDPTPDVADPALRTNLTASLTWPVTRQAG
ncbi:IgA peptidase M64 [Streptomyces sp. 1114.5]|uniref:M64 family metallopeptidase n=1 Tax=Streptomyces sp. 1114.5 TaxID=1938830 RepID=UPI000F17ED1E|nr:M64 family metallopeptidase [Streptomyces sp. 1114.5]RKT20142.1 IgA peptidase M64 [Streptomyces sp. 1114.5]